MRIENLYPRPVRGDFATTNQVRDDAAATYGTKARDLLNRSGGDAIGAISLLYLAADQRKATAQATDPTLGEQALAQTVREQRDAIDALTAERDKFEKWWKDDVHEATSLNADLCQQEVDADQITQLQSILRAVTASDGVFARLYTDDLRALPNGTVVRDEYGRAWTRIDDEDGGVWATPSEDTTMPSSYLTAKSAVYLAWVADL
jgi:hypothetical protein|nr:MAG TPA: hypothetical protein [Caudoviricetes sp.]